MSSKKPMKYDSRMVDILKDFAGWLKTAWINKKDPKPTLAKFKRSIEYRLRVRMVKGAVSHGMYTKSEMRDFCGLADIPYIFRDPSWMCEGERVRQDAEIKKERHEIRSERYQRRG